MGRYNMPRKKERKKSVLIAVLIVVGVLIVGFVAVTLWGNLTFGVTRYLHQENSLTGLKVLQISDLHNKKFGKDNSSLYNAISKENPDYIFLTGDVIEDSDLTVAKALVSHCASVAPTFYVSGNHEGDCGEGVFSEFLDFLDGVGVHFIDNQVVEAKYRDTTFAIVGFGDKNLYEKKGDQDYVGTTAKSLKAQSKDNYTLVLSHRPDHMQAYVEAEFDFVFAGHAHGGQWRLGRLGAYSKSQGLFPKYTSGLYQEGKTTMLVNRGLGNSAKWIPRIFNRPEITVVEFCN